MAMAISARTILLGYYSPDPALGRQEVYNLGWPQEHKSEQLGGLIPIEPLVKTSY